MNKIEKLIDELCPQGVERKTLGEIADYRRGSFPQPYGESRWYDGENAMPFVQVADVGHNMRLIENTKHKISKLAQPKSVFVPTGTVLVTLQGSIGRVAITQYDSYVDRTLAIFERFKIEINKKYFVYQLEIKFGIEKEKARGSTIKTITKKEFTQFQIPIPPLCIQKEIVKILDNFTQLEAELEAELEARKKQYEHCRDELLSFGDDVEFRVLGDCIKKNTGGGTPSKAVSNYWNGNIPWASVGDLSIDSIMVNSTRNFITEEGLKNSSSHLIPKNDVIVAVKISPGKMKIAGRDISINQDLRGLSLKNYLNNKFLTYYFQTINIVGNGTIVKAITVGTLNKIQIPIPPLSKQKQIVAILDKFDALVNDISTGLPAEIAARKKQYEYYRNQLLTFKPLEAQDAN